MRLAEIGGDRGPTQNSGEDGLALVRNIEAQLGKLALPDLYIVKSYDHLACTVNVVPKANPNGQVVYNVPVHGMGGSLRTYYGFRTVDNRDAEPDVGWLMFPKTDSRRAFSDFLRKMPPSSRIMQPFGAEFLPGVALNVLSLATPGGQTNPPNVVATGPGKATEMAPGDKGFLDPVTGAGIIIKKGTGRVVIVAPGGLYLLDLGEDFGDGTGVSLGGGFADPSSNQTFSS